MELEFVEVNETERTYIYRDGSELKIEKPKRLCIRPSGNHRLETESGEKWVVLAGWVAIKFKAGNWSL